MSAENISQMPALFEESKKGEAILLIDSSGSTSTQFDGSYSRNGITIFDKIAQIAGTLDHPSYRVIFWNSPNFHEGRFSEGTVVLPFVVKPQTLHTAFAAVAPYTNGGTCPPLGFQRIPPDWLRGDPIVYLFTDGQIGCSELNDAENKKQLVEEIKKLNTRLCIIAVENIKRDFNRIDEVNNAAGGDIYKLIQENGLTGKVMQFISYNPVQGGDTARFVQINKCKPPAGYVPYGDKYFSELRVNEFSMFVADELKRDNHETKQLEIAQKLSASLEYLTRDKPKRQADDIIRYFSSLFTVDSNLIRWILTEAIDKERGGQAAVFATYRAQLKNLFQQADELIKRDVCESIGVNNNFVSYVIENRVLTGSYRLIDKTLIIHGSRYPRSAYECVPVFPMLDNETKMSELQEQCLRQWTRCVYSAFYRVHPTSDEIIYLVLGDMLKVCNSNVDNNIKNAYRRLAKIILNKKRLNSMQTEYERIASGEVPLPNSGKIEDFEAYMRNTASKLNISSTPYKLWYDVCTALDPIVGSRQERHCLTELGNECKYEDVKEDNIPSGFSYDYTCIITTDDISTVGGHKILPHTSAVGSTCAPVYLLSEEGKQGLLRSNACVCPICYTPLNINSFEAVGPKINFDLPISYRAYESRFAESAVTGYLPSDRKNNVNNLRENGNIVSSNEAIRNANGNVGKLVILKGVVGAGKSTYAQKIKEGVLARGGACYVEGTDKYCNNGHHPRTTAAMVTNALLKIKEEKNDDIVVVIDTCGEQTGAKNYKVFGINFSGWTKVEIWPNLNRNNMRGYFAWSLRNVLLRKRPTANSTYYLNAESAGNQACIDVHRKKTNALFPRNKNDWQFSGATVYNLEKLAEDYAKLLPDFQLSV